MSNTERGYYEALASFQLDLKDSQNWNENEFEYFSKNYRPHDKSHDLIMLGFIRHLTLIRDEERNYLSDNLRIPEGIQSNWSTKLQQTLNEFWQDPEISSTKSLEIVRANRNRSKMPSVETGIINKIVDKLKQAKENAVDKKIQVADIDVSLFEVAIVDFVNEVLQKSLSTEISVNSDDVEKIDGALSNSVSEVIERHTTQVPIINRTLIDKDAAIADIKKHVVEFIKQWFSNEMVLEIKSDLINTAKSKLEEMDTMVPPEIPKSIQEQISALVEEKEVLEIDNDQTYSRYFVNEIDVIDYYVSAKLNSSYSSYSDFLNALMIHQDAKIILGPSDERYVSFPMESK